MDKTQKEQKIKEIKEEWTSLKASIEKKGFSLKQIALTAILSIAFFIFILIGLFKEKEEDELKQAQVNQLKYHEGLAGKKPDISLIDAVALPVKKYLEKNLVQPDTLEIMECSEIAFGVQEWIQRVKFKSRNEFDVWMIDELVFYMKHGEVVNVRGFENE
jgi:hypothetical protein